ncbi:MAG: transcriptional regulator [Ilumatobacteraceae bacterium]
MDRALLDRRAAIERERARSERASGGAVDASIRASWSRCTDLVDGARHQTPVDDSSDVEAGWDASPIRRAVPHLVEQLAAAGRDAGLLAVVTDPRGRVLWESATSGLRRGAERVGLVPGGRWDETAAGTNGIGMALVTGRPAAVFATEHWCAPVQDWVCYSAPVGAPDGSVAGVIDLSTTWDRANPLGLRTIGTLARLMEVELAAAWAMFAPGGLDVHGLGRGRVTIDGRAVALSPRQLELVVTLALVGTATLDELHGLLFGDRPVSRTTLRAEISHTRAVLGDVIDSRPYRLTVPCRLDALELLDRLGRGDVTGAIERYDGPLLPVSDAPLVVERRYHLDVALRTALLRHGTAAQLLRFARVHPSDLEVVQRAVQIAGPDDPDRPASVAALAVAEADLV